MASSFTPLQFCPTVQNMVTESLHYIFCHQTISGESCQITYGSGFFSNDNVLVGDLVVKSQVSCAFSVLPHITSTHVCCISNAIICCPHFRSSLKQHVNQVSHLSLGNLMASLALDIPRSRSAKLLRFGMPSSCLCH